MPGTDSLPFFETGAARHPQNEGFTRSLTEIGFTAITTERIQCIHKMLRRGEYSRPPRSCCGSPRPAQLLRFRSIDRQIACDHDLVDIARASRADEFIFKVVGDLFDGAFGGTAEAAAARHFHDQT